MVAIGCSEREVVGCSERSRCWPLCWCVDKAHRRLGGVRNVRCILKMFNGRVFGA